MRRFFLGLIPHLLPLLVLALTLPPALADRKINGPVTVGTGFGGSGSAINVLNTFVATQFGSCTWDSTHDVAPCIQAAITAASSAGSGAVLVPAGTFGLSSTVSLPSKVMMVGADWGNNVTACGTTLTWIGAASGVMAKVGDNTTATIAAAGIGNLCLDGDGIAGTGLQLRSAQFGRFSYLLISDVTANGVDADTGTVAASGTAHNNWEEIRITLGHANSVSANGWKTGIGTLTTDYHNNVHAGINISYQTGHGIVCGNSDANTWTKYSASAIGIGGGRPLVMQGSNVAVTNTCRHNTWYHGALGDSSSAPTIAEATSWTYPAVDNWILPFTKGGGQPNPIVEDGATLYCLTTGGEMCDTTTPLGNFKFSPRLRAIGVDYTIKSVDCGTNFATTAGPITFTLPAATGSACTVEITKQDTGRITVAAVGSDLISGAGTNSTTSAAGNVYTDYLFSSLRLQDAETGRWIVKNSVGPWQTGNGGGITNGGLARIGTVTASNQSVVSFTDIPGGMASLQLACSSLIPVSDNVNGVLQVGTGSTTFQNANYSYAVFGHNTGGAATPAVSTTGTGIQVNGGVGINASATEALSFTAYIRGIASTAIHKNVEWQASYENNTPVYEVVTGAGKWTGATTAVTAVRFSFSTGNVSSGQCTLFGMVP